MQAVIKTVPANRAGAVLILAQPVHQPAPGLQREQDEHGDSGKGYQFGGGWVVTHPPPLPGWAENRVVSYLERQKSPE